MRWCKKLCYYSGLSEEDPVRPADLWRKFRWTLCIQNLNIIHPNSLTEHLDGLSSHCDLCRRTKSPGWKYLQDKWMKLNSSLSQTFSTYTKRLQSRLSYPDTQNQGLCGVKKCRKTKEFCLFWLLRHSSDKYHPRRRNQKKAIKARRDISVGGEEKKEGDGRETAGANKWEQGGNYTETIRRAKRQKINSLW